MARGRGPDVEPAIRCAGGVRAPRHARGAFLSGANLMLPGAGWLESGLVASCEQFAIDVEFLRVPRVELGD
jgi:trimethylamine---corrinoid protein Co-methyltransferase